MRRGADHWALLGLDRNSSASQVREARRRLAKSVHPDAGGSLVEMQSINAAAAAALREIATSDRTSVPGRPARPARSHRPSPTRRDHPSFTIEALPVEAFEGLLVVASWLGDLVDDEPPYLLEVALSEPVGAWCRLDIVPDAGASTVSIAVGGDPRPPSIEGLRDAFVEGLNRLDWESLGS